MKELELDDSEGVEDVSLELEQRNYTTNVEDGELYVPADCYATARKIAWDMGYIDIDSL